MMSEFHAQQNVMMMRDIAEEIACRYAQLWNALLRSKHEALAEPVVGIMKECVEDIYDHLSNLILPSRLEIVEMNRTEHRSALQQIYPDRGPECRSGTGSCESRESCDRSPRDGLASCHLDAAEEASPHTN